MNAMDTPKGSYVAGVFFPNDEDESPWPKPGKLEQEVNFSSPHEGSNSTPLAHAASTRQDVKRQREHDNKTSREQETKKSRAVVDKDGKSRRPVNLTLEDSLSIAMKILAAKRQMPVWKLFNEAIRRYLIDEGELKE